jgi:hypothetical protein
MWRNGALFFNSHSSECSNDDYFYSETNMERNPPFHKCCSVLSIDCYFDAGLSTNTMNGILNIYDFVICSGISQSEITADIFVKHYFR